MVLRTGDRVKETTTTTGTGTITLGGAASGYQAFSAIAANGEQVAYAIVGGTEWEVGIGTWNTGGTLTRNRVLASSNAGALVNFSAGSKDVFCDYPAAHGIGTPQTHVVSVDTLIPADTSLFVARYLEIAPGKTLEIGLNADLEIG
jgi:hypothetical protein